MASKSGKSARRHWEHLINHCRSELVKIFVRLHRAVPAAYGGSQTRGRIRATVAFRATATRDPSYVCDLYTIAHSNAESLTH